MKESEREFLNNYLLEVMFSEGDTIELNISGSSLEEIEKGFEKYWMQTTLGDGSSYYINLSHVREIRVTHEKEIFKLVKDSDVY